MSTITCDPIEPATVLAAVQRPGNGGIVLFLGTVRDHADGRAVTAIDYDAHERLADRAMRAVVTEAREHWPTVDLEVAHRVGHLEVGEISVAVAAGSPHRAEAFAAARFVIDTLKERVPVWKKELSPEGDEWIHGSERVPSP